MKDREFGQIKFIIKSNTIKNVAKTVFTIIFAIIVFLAAVFTEKSIKARIIEVIASIFILVYGIYLVFKIKKLIYLLMKKGLLLLICQIK